MVKGWVEGKSDQMTIGAMQMNSYLFYVHFLLLFSTV